MARRTYTGAPQAPIGQVVVAALLGGAIAGAGAGAIDGLWSWSSASQFVPGFGGKLSLLVLLAAAYSFAGAILGVVTAVTCVFFSRATRLGDALRSLAAAHRRRADEDPRTAMAPLSIVIAGIPTIAGTLGLTFMVANRVLPSRKHIGLVIAVAMVASLGALVVGWLLTFVVARPIEAGLQPLARRPRIGRRLASLWALVIAGITLVGIAGAVGAIASWKTLSLLHLRPLWAGLVAGILAIPAVRAGHRVAARMSCARPALRHGGVAAGMGFLALLILSTGAGAGVRKAATRYSGLGGPLIRAYRFVGDFDHDGYSRILGGGDCNDWNASIHPSAVEIPDDGIDQNCVGGDATMRRDKDDLRFVPTPPGVPANFNVILLTVDTVRADHFGAYGYARDTTPNIDALAKHGTLFQNSWAHAPSTRYSMPAILTGRYPLDVYYDRSVSGWPGLATKNTTIAEVLEARGFRTGAILNYWYFTPQRHMNQGYQTYDNSNQRLHKGVPGKGPAETRGSSSRQQTDKAIQFIDKNASARFHLWVHYYDPHYEYERHPEVADFGSSKIDLYDEEIKFTDLQIGRLIDHLKKTGLYDRTVIVVTGDHGEGFGEHGIDLHGYHLYAAQTRVPLIIRVPGVAPRVVTTPVGHVDILPTLANLAGAPPSTQMMGESLVGPIAGTAPADRDRVVFQQLSYENNNEMRAAVSQRCHVIYNVSPHSSWELYRLDTDPTERRDVITTPGPCRDTRRALESWYDRSQIPAGAAEALLPGKPTIARPVDVDFGSMVLLGADLPTSPVKPGQSFDLTLTYQARGPLRGGWRIFAHFEGPRSQRFLADHPPPRPFEWWQKGQYIRYTRRVTVPRNMQNGSFDLWLGLFRKNERKAATSARVKVIENRALVGHIQVAR